MTTSKYETDFYTWANEQATLVRAGRFDEVDIENIAEELETLGRPECQSASESPPIGVQHWLIRKFDTAGETPE
jgi:hypothetical protein